MEVQTPSNENMGCAAELERLLNDCVVCGATLESVKPAIPHCEDCLVTDEQEYEWETKLAGRMAEEK